MDFVEIFFQISAQIQQMQCYVGLFTIHWAELIFTLKWNYSEYFKMKSNFDDVLSNFL